MNITVHRHNGAVRICITIAISEHVCMVLHDIEEAASWRSCVVLTKCGADTFYPR